MPAFTLYPRRLQFGFLKRLCQPAILRFQTRLLQTHKQKHCETLNLVTTPKRGVQAPKERIPSHEENARAAWLWILGGGILTKGPIDFLVNREFGKLEANVRILKTSNDTVNGKLETLLATRTIGNRQVVEVAAQR